MSKKVVTIKPVARFIGMIISILCLVYITIQIFEHSSSLGRTLYQKQNLIIIGISSIFYACLISMQGLCWHLLLKSLFSKFNIAIKVTLYIYARTSIAKYLPGNVGHFAGRHFFAHQYGIPHQHVGTSYVLEITCLVMAASFLSVMTKSPIILNISPHLLIMIGACSVALIPVLFIKFFAGRVFENEKPSILNMYWCILHAILLSIFYFFCSSILFYFFGGIIIKEINFNILEIIGIYSISWLTGFITIGSPAGVGVRESVMIILLSPRIGQADALLISILFRFVTTIGDVIFFVSSFIPWFKQEADVLIEPKNN